MQAPWQAQSAYDMLSRGLLLAAQHSRQSLLSDTADIVYCVTQQTMYALTPSRQCPAASHNRHCLLNDTAGIVCCATQQTMSVVSHSKQYLLRHRANNVVPSHTADEVFFHQCWTMIGASHSHIVQRVLQQTLLVVVSQQTMATVSHRSHCSLCDEADAHHRSPSRKWQCPNLSLYSDSAIALRKSLATLLFVWDQRID